MRLTSPQSRTALTGRIDLPRRPRVDPRIRAQFPKTAAAGHRSGRRHETPLEAPREYEKVTARPQYEAGANHIFLSIFFFFGFFFAAMIHFLLV
jgi:hypothetical protein